VLLDLEMPVKDGFAALVEIRNHPRFSGIPVMAVTAKAMLLERDRIVRAGFDGYITKPIDIAKLRERVDALLAHPEKEKAHERRR
jgi:CheY-like chemotaxis protein